MLTFANAKINLGLFLTEKRTDGYHNLQTVFYPIKIYDVVELIDAEETSCMVKGIEVPGETTDNICLRAFKMLQAEFNLPNQRIILLKNIPVGAGLGGGSADAAFLIKLINDKFNLGISIAEMENYARKLGADCAFFIRNQPVYAFGKGDEFEEAEIDLSSYFLVLVKPPVHVSTAQAYANVSVKQPVQPLKRLIELPLSEWQSVMLNDFEPSVFAAFPQIAEIKTKLYEAGAKFALMSGSGSSVFGIFDRAVQLPELEKENLVFYNL
ncbi:4-(cytidine 5'-diphospho)-2-C-methyl-D-erythritol kinase [Pedobacter montanisoli]|uniref:4-diphosphocytidyl-2-C-methyl-D-erythritol kinase n=1 Tax=Pedobacter montanisoli TaxID=2923277 RepID=A0ABS9ZZW7_9SPHI|nr:4-(cytidine 5'-diphospho)-2-C-methyl-D-erythritol kinase [Pedobacter montanisoli]MCJ0743861.1 4-(cytidine 5'-diphospho)-2-C-methyl-D-erythritol kinase [Pedobacter montanisoli]